ncbi:MAG: HAMP domain-containing histidine kinase [Chloroflexi bacterium]|nr:HAMP domain-containing histidine kinase [Chloroflexota bacterium]
MRTLRSRLIISHLLPLLLTLPILALVLIYILETQILLTEMSEGITERAALVAEAINGHPEVLTDPELAEAYLNRLEVIIDGKVLLFTSTGELLASTHALPADFSGLAKALAGEIHTIITYGLFQQQGQAYVPVRDINDQLLGIVAVTGAISGVAENFGRMRLWILAVLFVELLLAAAMGFILATRLERPIGRASRAVVDIAEGRDIEPVPKSGPEEIQALATAVNILAERLRLLEEIRRRSLANIVHEIGRPLGAIRSAVHVLRQGMGEDPEIREELLMGVEQEIEGMQPLLDDLSQLHGQVQDTIHLNLQAIALSDWLPHTLLPWRGAAVEKNLEWNAQIPGDLPTLSIDPERLAQALGNLLSNAIKYTPEGGRVGVAAGTNAAEIWIEVSDNGPGISETEQARVFEAFYRSSRERRFPQGLGVGLTLAQELVHAHGGELTLDSSIGEGSLFTIRLPYV